MGEGGCVLTDKPLLQDAGRIVPRLGPRLLVRARASDNTCGKRFDWQLGDLPCGYDHKYTYSHIGYNLKLTDMQAAVGVAQLQKLAGFIEARRRNFGRCTKGCDDLEEFFVLPEATPGSEPSWFGFPIAVRARRAVHAQPGDRVIWNERKIATRLSVRRQPGAPAGVPRRRSTGWSAPLANTDFVMNQVFWIGVYPGIRPPNAGVHAGNPARASRKLEPSPS